MANFKKLQLSVMLFMIFIVQVGFAVEGNPERGHIRSATCVACHGENGISKGHPHWPNLAGQKLDYLAKQLTDFREKRRQDPAMTAFAGSLTDQDIADLATYFSSLERSK